MVIKFFKILILRVVDFKRVFNHKVNIDDSGFNSNKVEMFKKMRSNQPGTPSAGSCFKNPDGDYAGRLIEAVGLKGVMQGDMCFSNEHANFLVNNGNGTFDDALWLIREAQTRVKKEFALTLECEIVILESNLMSNKSYS